MPALWLQVPSPQYRAAHFITQLTTAPVFQVRKAEFHRLARPTMAAIA
ncbi:hypothetical protein [Pseudomonas sp. BIOMIG1BAC]